MAKKNKKGGDGQTSAGNATPYSAAAEAKEQEKASSQENLIMDKLPKDVQDKLKGIKSKLEKFQKKVLEKFDKYIVGIALLPPPQKQEAQGQVPSQLSTR